MSAMQAVFATARSQTSLTRMAETALLFPKALRALIGLVVLLGLVVIVRAIH